jgi:hypothetical protein
MQGHATNGRDLTNLTGEVMNENDFLRYATEANHPVLLVALYVFKAQLAYAFGFNAMAERICNELAALGQVFVHTITAPHLYFFATLISYQRYRETNQRKHLKVARKYKKILEQAQSNGSPNVGSHLALLAAEEVSLRNTVSLDVIQSAYNNAIQAMATEQWPHLEGLANERAGFVFAKKLDNAAAVEPHFERAMELYRYHCKATAKYEWLLESSTAVLSTCCRQGEQNDHVNVHPPGMGGVITIEEQSPA